LISNDIKIQNILEERKTVIRRTNAITIAMTITVTMTTHDNDSSSNNNLK